jgi:hypothetical protein
MISPAIPTHRGCLLGHGLEVAVPIFIQLPHAGGAGDFSTSPVASANISGVDGLTGGARQPVHNIGNNLTDGFRGAGVPFVFHPFHES